MYEASQNALAITWLLWAVIAMLQSFQSPLTQKEPLLQPNKLCYWYFKLAKENTPGNSVVQMPSLDTSLSQLRLNQRGEIHLMPWVQISMSKHRKRIWGASNKRRKQECKQASFKENQQRIVLQTVNGKVNKIEQRRHWYWWWKSQPLHIASKHSKAV